MISQTASATPVVVPDRFESLERRAEGRLNAIVVPVNSALTEIDRTFARMAQADRGAFLILRGESGAGKSTFLHTLHLYRKEVTTISVPGGTSIRAFLASQTASESLQVFVLEEREAAISFSDAELEDWLHAINGFIRSDRGRMSIVVWPCNTDALRDRVVSLAKTIGGESLVGTGLGWYNFSGPDPDQYVGIAEKTLATLNQGATFSDLGLTVDSVNEAANASATIGGLMSRVHELISSATENVQRLLPQERPKLWIVVAAGNDIESEVAALTRGRYAAINTERLMTSTEANIVSELKKYPDQVGILGTVLDAKVRHLPILTSLAIARAFSDSQLKQMMQKAGLKLKPDSKNAAVIRLMQTDLAAMFQSSSQGLLTRGKKPGPETLEAFRKLAELASINDTAINRALGEALVAAGLIESFAVEQDFGSGLTRRTDILAQHVTGPVRIEVMWRGKTSRADIANYTLTKVANYGRAVGFLS